MEDAFVVNRLRTKPVEYTVTLSHFVLGGTWVMGISIDGAGPSDATQRASIAADLRAAALQVELAQWEEKT